MYDFLDLKLVQYMSEETSLTAVASRARMSLPAVSQRLAKLEEHFQVKLVKRSGGFGLTPAGQLLFRAAANINAEIADVERGLHDLHAKSQAHLTISCSDSTLIDDLPLVLDRLVADIPGLRIHVQDTPTARLTDQLIEGAIDVALLHDKINTPGVELTPYRTERICLVVPLSHPLAQQPGPIQLADTFNHELILVGGGRQTDLASEIQKLTGKAPNVRVTVQSIEALCTLVGQTNLGIGLAPETAARRHAPTQPIQVRRLAEAWTVRQLYACTRPLHESNQPTQRFVALLEERFRSKLS